MSYPSGRVRVVLAGARRRAVEGDVVGQCDLLLAIATPLVIAAALAG